MMSPQGNNISLLSPEELLATRFYFRSPILTLLESLEDQYQEHISLDDLSQAYDILSCRIRQVVEYLITPSNPLPPALLYLQDHSSSLALCLRRDISYAFVRTGPDSPPSEALIPDSVPQHHDLQDEELQYAEDSSHVCQLCLKLLCIIFKFPVLSGLLTDDDLSTLLHDITRIATTLSLPSPNSQKLRALAVLAISEQQLPLSLLKGQKRQILLMLNGILFGLEDIDDEAQAINDAFQMIHGLVSSQTLLFLEPLHKFMDAVLQRLLSPHRAIRIAAAHALAGYSRAVVSCSESISPSLYSKIEECICTFAELQLANRKSKSGIPAPSSTLRRYFSDLITASASGRKFGDACWAYSILASCIVLSNGKVFSRSRMIRTITIWMHDLHNAFGKEVVAIHLSVWRCFVWSLSRLRHHIDRQATSSTRKAPTTGDLLKTWDSALKFVHQDLELQNGSALVALLMNNPPSSTRHQVESTGFISETLDVVQTMIGSESDILHEEGLMLLASLVGISDTQPVSPWTNSRIVAHAVFDGTMLYNNERKSGFYSFDIDLGHIPRIPQDEVSNHWDILLAIWTIATKRLVFSGNFPAVNADLLRIWHELLISQSQLTQGNSHLAVSPEIIQDIVKVIAQLLESPKELLRGVTTKEVQLAQLKTIYHLWIVTKFAVGPLNEGDTAAAILSTVLSVQFLIDSVEVKTSWSELCSELMIAQDPLLLSALQERSDLESERELRRRLWKTVTVQYMDTKTDEDVNWERRIKLLLIPLANHNMSPDERELWVKLLDCALDDAETLSISSSTVLQTIAENVLSSSLTIPAPLTFTLLSHLQLKSEHTLPLSLFDHINSTLLMLYPPRPDNLSDSLQLFSALTDLITNTPQCHLINIIVHLSKSLTVWFHNDSESIDDTVFNDNIISLYCTTLHRLESTPLTVSLLHDLTPFLTSPFNFIPIPGLAPRAFRKFWQNAASHVESLETDCPSDLQDFLDAWGTMCDEHQSQESQMSFSSIPDSQPPTSQEDHEYAYLRSLSLGRDEDIHSGGSSKKNASQKTDSSSLCNFSKLTFPQGAQPAPRRRNLSIPFGSTSNARHEDDALFADDSWPSVPGMSSSEDHGIMSLGLSNKKRSRDDKEPEDHLNVNLGDISSPHALDHSQDGRQAKRARSVSDSASPAATPTRRARLAHRNEPELSQDDYDSWEITVPSPEVQRIRQELQ